MTIDDYIPNTAKPIKPHPDDVAVDNFAAAMKEKLAIARGKGRSGWEECSPAELSAMLHEHVAKGDPRDVANFCMFLWNLGQPITQCHKAPAVAQEPVLQRVMGRLADLLDEDQFAEIEGIVVSVGIAPPPATVQPAVAVNEQMLEALNDFSDYVRTEQSSTDGHVQYSNTQINRLAFKARSAIAAAEAAKGCV